jgi:hypothetical protein
MTLDHRDHERTRLPRGVALLLEVTGPFLSDGGRSYRDLAERVEVFLAARGLRGQWGALDVAAFLAAETRTRRDKIEACCNLSAMLAWIVDHDRLDNADARRIWKELRAHCPADRRAHAYIELGAREFAGVGAN